MTDYFLHGEFVTSDKLNTLITQVVAGSNSALSSAAAALSTAAAALASAQNSLQSDSLILATGSTVGRKMQDRFSDVINVKDYGALGNGIADDAPAIRLADARISELGGGTMFFPPGEYKIGSPVTFASSNMALRGSAVNGTVLAPVNGAANMFTFNGNWIIVEDFLVNCTATFTAGYLFEFTTTSGNIYIERVASVVGYNVIGFTGANAAQTYINMCLFNGFLKDGIYYGPSFGGLSTISNVNMFVGSNNLGASIRVKGGDTHVWTNVQMTACYEGVVIQPIANGFVRNVFAVNCLSDGIGSSLSGGAGWLLDGTASGAHLSRLKFTNCWAGVRPANGFHVNASDDVTFSNCIAIGNVLHGFYINGTSGGPVKIIGCTASGNGLTAPGSYDGIHVDNFAAVFTITDCTCLVVGSDIGNTQRYGICVSGPTHDHYIITGNQLWGNLTGALLDEGIGTNKIVTNNLLN